MNFIGHATVALWTSQVPAFVLGSMLPDLTSMAGLRLPRELPAGALSDGVALHHRTDAVFHGTPAFLTLTQWTLDRLTALNVARGPARAVAHVGVEMLLDGELLGYTGVADAYQAAILELPSVRALFSDTNELARWDLLARRLQDHGAPYDYRNTEAVSARLVRIFRPRRRLSLDDSSERIVRSVLPDVQRHVVAETPRLLTSLRRELKNGGAPSNGPVLV